MTNRRQFLKISASAATLSALGSQSTFGATSAPTRKIWILSDLHTGHVADGKDGGEWFELACSDMRESKLGVDYAITLGDIAHNGVEAQYQRYIDQRAKSGIANWHEIAGNHDYHGDSAETYIRMLRGTEPYSVIDGNIAWFFLSDEAPGVSGNLTEKSCQWLERELARHEDKTTIVCSHQLVKGTVFKSTIASFIIHPAERVAGIIAKSKIDLWLCGHEHHTPYSKEHLIRKDGTTYINVASMSHAYNTNASQSYLMEFMPGSREIVARRREHDGKRFQPEFEVKIPLRHELQPGNA